MTPYASLFDDTTPEDSLWHGLPMGLHAFGGIHWVKRDDVKSQGAVDTTTDEYERSYWPARHWPSLSHGTVYVVTYDAINVWCEGGGIDRDRFTRTRRRWFPSHLDLGWQAGGLEIGLRVAMVDGDRALIRADVRNKGGAPYRGRLVVRGDINRVNYNQTDQDWGRSHVQACWAGEKTVVLEREVAWGTRRKFYPYILSLKPEDATYHWLSMSFATAFAFSGDGWRREMISIGGGHETWQLSRDLELAPGAAETFQVGFAGHWNGREAIPESVLAGLPGKAEASLAEDWGSAVARNRRLWEDIYARVPALQGEWPTDWVRLYYKAWTSVYYNTIAATDMIWFRSRHAMGVCCKVAPSTMAMCPATWETALSALCLSLTDPAMAQELLEGSYQAMEPDGYLGEWPGDRRITSLPLTEPLVVWACYRRARDRAFLERLYPKVRTNLYYKLRNPSWRVHGVQMVRNYAYAHAGAIYTLKMAEALGRPKAEQDELREAIDDSRAAVHAFWNETGGFYNANCIPALGDGLVSVAFGDGTDAEALLPLFRAAKASVRPRLIELIRAEFLSDGGAIRRAPRTLPFEASGSWGRKGKPISLTIKESNQMFLLKAIKDEDRALFERVARGTITTIRTAGDFHECYDLRGYGRHNGPGSIFGAFAVIWAMLLSEDQVDGVYE